MGKIFPILKKIFLYGFAAGVTIIIVTLLVFWLEHTSSLTLPKPTGSYEVGRSTFDWIDSSRIDSLASLTGIMRELTVWIWYPASTKKSDPTVEYLPQDWQKALA